MVTARRLLPLPLWAIVLVSLAFGCSRAGDAEGGGRETSAAAVAPLPSAPLAVGALAPAVTFPVHTGEAVRLEQLRGKPVVVYFYPKDDTPGCTLEAQEIRELYEQIRRTSAIVIGVSADDQDSHRAFAEKHALPFLLASDEGGQLARAFGVPLKNGRSARVTFVVGADGKVARVFPQVTPKGHAAELLTALGG
jgi:thioredoxin-dependent peroxiredoxin